MKPRHKRLAIIVVGVVGLSVAALFVLNAFRNNLVFFYSPTEVFQGKAPLGRTFRIGGLVKKGSLRHSDNGLAVSFVVTDLNKSLPVHYKGALPDLFREGQGVVAEGRLSKNHMFMASQVLAKHDEKYMPPEAAAALHGGSFVPGAQAKMP